MTQLEAFDVLFVLGGLIYVKVVLKSTLRIVRRPVIYQINETAASKTPAKHHRLSVLIVFGGLLLLFGVLK